MKAIGYIRVSTVDQADHGVSLEEQRERIEAYAKLKGLDLAEVIADEGVSASKPLADRPGGSEVARLAASGKVDAIVAVKLDRLFRDTVDALTSVEAWERRGVALHLIDLGGNSLDTSSALGRLFLTTVAALGEMERRLTGERTAAALQHKRARRERVGTIPYGYRLAADGVALLDHPAEQRTVARIQSLRRRGLSFQAVADTLNTEGAFTRRGTPWSKQRVHQVATFLPLGA